MVKKATTIAVLGTVMTFVVNAEAQDDPANYDGLTVLASVGVNVAINSVACGIAAAVNDRDVVKDMSKCAAGALLQSTASAIAIADIPVFTGITARSLNQIGTSLVDNTVAGLKPLEKVYYDLGPFLFNFSEDGVGVEWRIMPLVGIIANFAKGATFDGLSTLNYQTITFKMDMGDYKTGNAVGNVMLYNSALTSDDTIIAHEFIHTLQYGRAQPIEHLNPLGEYSSKIGLRVGEDVGHGLLMLPQVMCRAMVESNNDCRNSWAGFPIEMEAYGWQMTRDNHVNN
jgi:hypothetical protein